MKKYRQEESSKIRSPLAVPSTDRLFIEVTAILEGARRQTVRSVNAHMVTAYWLIGWRIVEAEQGGKTRADYGTGLIANLSARLTERYGRGYSPANLANFRDFFLTYRDRTPQILYPVGREFDSQTGATSIFDPTGGKSAPPNLLSEKRSFHTNLGWSHYRALMRVKNLEARQFYEREAATAGWSRRELERQIGTLYYERLLLSKDKRGMLAENRKPNAASHPLDVIKDPYVLEFLNLPEDHRLNETELEERLITHLQSFLLELGRGFAFIGRQQRLTLDGDHFYADLVFYHARLKCYIVLDLKTRRLTHADLGQMQLYVNYYDREVAGEDDNPTLGLILCTDKNDAVVRYVLGKNQEKIFASRYRLVLPTEAELAAEVRREMKALGMGGGRMAAPRQAKKRDAPRHKSARKRTP
jgi:predicted nuclease of restriction endonuclease-like (RecB) superfamily